MRWRLALLALALVVLAGFTLWGELQRPYLAARGEGLVVIEPGARAPQVAELLVSRGVLAHRWPFLILYWLGRTRRLSLKAGEYSFDRPLALLDVYRKLVRGEVYLHRVVIPEGSDRFDVAAIFNERLGLDPQELLRATDDASAVRDLDPRAPTLEGYLFPDTYRFPRGVSASAVVAAMKARFREVLESRFPLELRASPDRLHDVLTLASMVEKETPAPDERAIIAGVFARRVQKGWPLQCDPTVVYARRLSQPLGGRASDPILRSDLSFDSPYNTYRYSGLPPGPIANSGEASIRAALDPAPGSLLYFVSNNAGGHVFARTLAEHRRNVARYHRELALRRGRPKVESSGATPRSKPRRGDPNATRATAKSAESRN